MKEANTYVDYTISVTEVLQVVTLLIYVLFFVIAGAHLQIGFLPKIGWIGLIYILMRTAAKIGGASIGAHIARGKEEVRKYLGFGLFTQAGVTVGLAIVIGKEFSAYGDLPLIAINTITATTIILEIIGPIGVKYAITKAGEVNKQYGKIVSETE